jgi:hypothetical protein
MLAFLGGDCDWAMSDKLLIAIVTCENRKEQTQSQRDTWVKDVMTGDVKFFLGKQDREPLDGEIFLDVGDDYASLPAKVREVSRWARANDYRALVKLDDDVVFFPTRMIEPKADYAGWKQEPVSANYVAGMCYWLSRRAIEVMAQAELTDEPSEDRWTGKVLLEAGIRAEVWPKIQWFGKIKSRNQLPLNTHARLSSSFVAGEFNPSELREMYRF